MTEENTVVDNVDEFGAETEEIVTPIAPVEEGGMINIKVGVFPGQILAIDIPTGSTIGQAIRAFTQSSEIDVSSMEVRHNGMLTSDLDAPASANDKIYLSTSKKGA